MLVFYLFVCLFVCLFVYLLVSSASEMYSKALHVCYLGKKKFSSGPDIKCIIKHACDLERVSYENIMISLYPITSRIFL